MLPILYRPNSRDSTLISKARRVSHPVVIQREYRGQGGGADCDNAGLLEVSQGLKGCCQFFRGACHYYLQFTLIGNFCRIIYRLLRYIILRLFYENGKPLKSHSTSTMTATRAKQPDLGVRYGCRQASGSPFPNQPYPSTCRLAKTESKLHHLVQQWTFPDLEVTRKGFISAYFFKAGEPHQIEKQVQRPVIEATPQVIFRA